MRMYIFFFNSLMREGVGCSPNRTVTRSTQAKVNTFFSSDRCVSLLWCGRPIFCESDALTLWLQRFGATHQLSVHRAPSERRHHFHWRSINERSAQGSGVMSDEWAARIEVVYPCKAAVTRDASSLSPRGTHVSQVCSLYSSCPRRVSGLSIPTFILSIL